MPRPVSPSSKENRVVASRHQLGGADAGPRRRLQPLGEHKPSNVPFKKAWGREEDLTIKADGAVKWLDGAASVCYRSRVQKEASMVPPSQSESPKQGKLGETCPPLTPTRESSSIVPSANAPPAEPSCSPDIIRKKGSRDVVAEGCFGIGPSVQGSVIDRRKSKPRALLTVEPLPNVATLVWDDEQQSKDLPRPGRASLEWISDDDSITDFSGTCDGSSGDSVSSGFAQQGLSKKWEDFRISEIYEGLSSQQLFRKGDKVEHFQSDDSLTSLRTLLRPPKSHEVLPKCVQRVAALENNDGFVEQVSKLPIFGATLNVHVSDEPDSNKPVTAFHDPTFVNLDSRRLQDDFSKTRTLSKNRSCYNSEVDTVMGAYESCRSRMGVEMESSEASSVSKPSLRKQNGSRDSGRQSNHSTTQDRYSGRTSQEMEGIHEAEYCKPNRAASGGDFEACLSHLKVADALHKLTVAQFERASEDTRSYKCSSRSTVDTTSANGSGSLSKQVHVLFTEHRRGLHFQVAASHGDRN